MTIKTAIAISLIAVALMLAYSIIQAMFSHPWILLVPAGPVACLGGWFAYNWGMVIREKRLLIQSERKRNEIVSLADGLGQRGGPVSAQYPY